MNVETEPKPFFVLLVCDPTDSALIIISLERFLSFRLPPTTIEG